MKLQSSRGSPGAAARTALGQAVLNGVLYTLPHKYSLPNEPMPPNSPWTALLTPIHVKFMISKQDERPHWIYFPKKKKRAFHS